MPYGRTNPPVVAALLAAAALAPAAAFQTVTTSDAQAWQATPPAPIAQPSPADRFVATTLPDSAAGRQAGWLIEASNRLPLSPAELRGHTSARWRAQTGSLAQRPALLRALAAARGLRLAGLNVVEPAALVASVRDRAGRRLVLTVFADRAGRIDNAVLGAAPALPRPTGRATVGSDRVQLTRAGRSLTITRTYPAAGAALDRPLARYASPALAAALAPLYAADPGARAAALAAPVVGVHARAGAPARPGRLPVVLLSPGGGASTVLYQALSEDLASHGYLVVAVDDLGDAPVELADGEIVPVAQTFQGDHRVADLRFVLRRLNAIGYGPLADRRRVAAIGHSIGGSTAAALMRQEPSIRAGVDMDGLIEGPASRRGVAGAFMVMSAGPAVLARRDVRGLLAHSTGPRLGLQFDGFDHSSFGDAPVVAPLASGVGRHPSARDVAVQRAYLRAFVDRYVRGHGSKLLDGPSARWPQVSIRYRARCCR